MSSHRHILPILVLLMLAGVTAAWGQPERREKRDFTTEGREFWLVFQKNFRDWVTDEKLGAQRPADPLQLELFVTSSRNARVTVEIRGLGFRREFDVPGGQVINIPIDTAAQVRSSERIEDLGIHVTSTEPVAVYGLNRRFQTTDTYLAHPVNVLGTSYRAMGYKWLQDDLLSQVAIIGTAENTEVTITPTVRTAGNRPAKRPFTVTLDEGEVFQIRPFFDAKGPSDLTGTRITSDKPVAVFSGHNCAYVPDRSVKACNLLVEQLPSTSAWGRQFFVGALSGRSSAVIRVLANEDSTVVFENNRMVALLNAGQFYENPNQTQHTMVTSTRPVLVAQFSKGFDNGDNVGDPMMIIVAPTEQFLSSYRFATPVRGSWRHYVNLIVPTASLDSLRLDGVKVDRTLFRPFGLSLYSVAQIEVSYGTHVISNSRPFGLYSYGFGYDEAAYDAYGNGGGQSLIQVIQYPDTVAPMATASFARTPGDARGVVTAVMRDDRINDKGIEEIVPLDNDNLDVDVPVFEIGTPQVPVSLRPVTPRVNGYAQFRLRDRAGNMSYWTICARYDERGDSMVVQVAEGLDRCDFSPGRSISPWLGYSVIDNRVTIPKESTLLGNAVPLEGNPGTTAWSVGVHYEHPWSSDLSLTGRAAVHFWNANVVGYDSGMSFSADGTPIAQEFTLERHSANLGLAAGAQLRFASRRAYLLGLINVITPLYVTETYSRTLLSPSTLVYQNNQGTLVEYEGGGPSGLAIGIVPEIGIGASIDLPHGFRLFGELSAGYGLTTVAADRDWTVSWIASRIGMRLRI